MEKEFKRGVELLDSTRHTDGSAFGSSKKSRAQKEWGQAQYVINQYVNKKETWAERRGFYGQVSDSLRKVGHEFGASSWGGPSEAHKDFLGRLEKLQKDFQALTGPEGAAKEKELGYFKR